MASQSAQTREPLPHQWIADRLDTLGKKKGDLAAALGMGRPGSISDLLKGKRRLDAAEVRPLAEYLEIPVELVLDRFAGKPVPADLNDFLINTPRKSNGFITDNTEQAGANEMYDRLLEKYTDSVLECGRLRAKVEELEAQLGKTKARRNPQTGPA